MSWLVDKASSALASHTNRRGFLIRAAVVGSALVVDPLDYILHPGTAYSAVCTCGDPTCDCSSACCDGYTEFCCTLHGSNSCPPGTIAGGWWRADGSAFCNGGPRYYIDCHGECADQDDGELDGQSGICTNDGLACGCANGDCNNRVAGCVTFRYGQCHQEIPRMGRIACRVVTCTPAYILDSACTNDALYDEQTANHNAACLQERPFIRRAYASTVVGDQVWLVDQTGAVYTTGGSQRAFGEMAGRQLNAPIVGIAAHPDGAGYWMVGADGGVFAFGTARFIGSMGGVTLNAPIVNITATSSGNGYWLVASDGGVFAFGDARFAGSTGGLTLQQPIVGLSPTPAGDGYWLVASDGGVFAFGAAYKGSEGGQALGNLIAGLVPTASGDGYCLWGQDGSVYSFGDAPSAGDYPHLPVRSRNLRFDGVDAFFAMSLQTNSYSLWAAAPLGPPPRFQRYDFTPVPETTTTTPSLLHLPKLPPLPPLPPL